jgi:hypothetical protein
MGPETIHIPRTEISKIFDDVIARTSDGARCIWLFGETGQGKTHFLTHYLDEVKERYLAAYALCSSPLGNQSVAVMKPYQPLKDAMEDLLTKQTSFRRNLNLIRNISLTVLACIPFVGEVAYAIKEIRRDVNEYKRGEREVDFTNFVQEYFHSLAAIAEVSPILIVIDDIQWADGSTIQALQYFFSEERWSRLPITFALSARMDEMQSSSELVSFHTQMSQAKNSTEIHLPPFDARQIRSYYQTRFPQSSPHDDLLFWLEQKTGGNPFFLQSYIQHLLIEEILQQDGTLRGTLESYRGMPAEIKVVNNWLMKSLSDEDLHLLLSASVLGHEFSLHELVHLSQTPALDLIRRLRHIRILYGICEPLGYKFINGKESSVYHFTQHAIHTALYNELAVEEREALHRITAQYLNDIRREKADDPEALNSLAGALMLHARLGHQPELEYASILTKAQTTSEILDEPVILERLRALAPSIGVPLEQIESVYRNALRFAPLSTKHGISDRVFAPDEESVPAETLGMFVSQVVQLLEQEKTVEAFKALDTHIRDSEKRKRSVHPMISVLFAMAAHILKRDEHRAQTELQLASQSTAHPTFAAVAQLALVLFHDDQSDEEMMRLLRKANAYSGRHSGVVQTLVAYIVHTKFGNQPQYADILRQHALPQREQEYLRDGYPELLKKISR